MAGNSFSVAPQLPAQIIGDSPVKVEKRGLTYEIGLDGTQIPHIDADSPVVVEHATDTMDWTVKLDPTKALVRLHGGVDIGVSTDPGDPNSWTLDYTGSGGSAVTVEVVAVSPSSVDVGNPKLTGGALVIDGVTIGDKDAVLLPNQNNPVENGPRIYDMTSNTLGRPDFYATGATIRQPFYVAAGDDGVLYGGTTWALASPSVAVVDAGPTTWVNADTGAGLQGAGAALMGPWQPYYGPRVATPRNLTSFDLPTDRPRSSATIYFPRTISRAVSRVGYVSDYISPSSVWSNQSALLAMLNEYNTVFVDRSLCFTGEITVPAGKRIEFTSSGRYGPTKILQLNPAASIFTLSSDVDIRGLMVIEYVFRSNAATKALKGAASRVRIEALETKGVDYAINLSGAIDDVWIGSVGVDNIGTDVPLYIGASPGTTGQESVRCQRVRNQPNVTTVTNANKTYTPHLDGRVLVYSGAMTANRSVTIASNTRIGSGEFRVSHQASGGFTVDVAGLKTLSNGQTAHVGFTGDGIATLLG